MTITLPNNRALREYQKPIWRFAPLFISDGNRKDGDSTTGVFLETGRGHHVTNNRFFGYSIS